MHTQAQVNSSYSCKSITSAAFEHQSLHSAGKLRVAVAAEFSQVVLENPFLKDNHEGNLTEPQAALSFLEDRNPGIQRQPRS